MLLRVSEGQSWSDTILRILPMRKGAKLKNPDDTESNSIDYQDNSNSIEDESSIINTDSPIENMLS